MELKPCPFCNKKPTMFETSEGWWCDCINDSCSTQPTLQEPYHLKENAIKAWNKRDYSGIIDELNAIMTDMNEKEIRGLIEKLEEG